MRIFRTLINFIIRPRMNLELSYLPKPLKIITLGPAELISVIKLDRPSLDILTRLSQLG